MPGRLQAARASLAGGRSAVPSLPQWTALQGSLSSETPRRLLPANSPPSPVPKTPTIPSPPLPVGQRAWGWGPACSSWGGWWAVGRGPHATRSLCPIQAPETLPCEAHSGTIERGHEKPAPRGTAPPFLAPRGTAPCSWLLGAPSLILGSGSLHSPPRGVGVLGASSPRTVSDRAQPGPRALSFATKSGVLGTHFSRRTPAWPVPTPSLIAIDDSSAPPCLLVSLR